MSSFNAIFHVAGRDYPIVHCAYEFTQFTGERGRVTSKVKSGLLTLVIDVPDGSELLAWAVHPRKKLSGNLIFEATDNPIAREKLVFEDGFCVSYEEVFVSGSAHGAYRCTLQISAAKLKLGTVTKDNTWVETR